MNQRIKELAEQAGLLPKEIGPVVETPHMKKKQQDLEKFAELIVRECIDIIDEEGSHEGGSIRSMKKIREHFGVEE